MDKIKHSKKKQKKQTYNQQFLKQKSHNFYDIPQSNESIVLKKKKIRLAQFFIFGLLTLMNKDHSNLDFFVAD